MTKKHPMTSNCHLTVNRGTDCSLIQVDEPVTNCHGLDSHDMLMKLKDSGIPWIGLIPEHWEVVRIKNIYAERTELSSTGEETLLSVSEYYGIAPTEEKTENDFITRADSLVGYKKCFKGDFVSNIMLAWKGSFGTTDQDGIVSPAYCVYKPIDEVSPKYYHYLFRTELFKCVFKQYSKGVIDSRLRLYSPYFMAINTIVPPLEEQERIAAWLDGKCGEIDELIEVEQLMISNLEAYRQAVITEAVTHGLNHNINVKNSTVYWIGLVPNHWDIAKMKYFVQISNGSDPKTEGEIPVYGSGANSFKTCGESKDGPTVLIGRKGATLHIPHYIEGKYWNVDTAFDTKMKEYDLRYFYYLAGILDYKAYISATTLPSMTQSNYENMLIPIPPLSEQREIAEYLDVKCAKIDELIKVKQEKIEALKEYRQSLIFEAVTDKTSIN